jgi:quercetin dioxygenase-like cupin family protein
VHHKVTEAVWGPFRLDGFEARDTGISDATVGVAGVQVARKGAGVPGWATHDSDILFTFVMEGAMTLEGAGRDPFSLAAGDAFVIPPGMPTRYSDLSEDIELLEVSLPGIFTTRGV